jgi:hypothetical protein
MERGRALVAGTTATGARWYINDMVLAERFMDRLLLGTDVKNGEKEMIMNGSKGQEKALEKKVIGVARFADVEGMVKALEEKINGMARPGDIESMTTALEKKLSGAALSEDVEGMVKVLDEKISEVARSVDKGSIGKALEEKINAAYVEGMLKDFEEKVEGVLQSLRSELDMHKNGKTDKRQEESEGGKDGKMQAKIMPVEKQVKKLTRLEFIKSGLTTAEYQTFDEFLKDRRKTVDTWYKHKCRDGEAEWLSKVRTVADKYLD